MNHELSELSVLEGATSTRVLFLTNKGGEGTVNIHLYHNYLPEITISGYIF